MRLSGQLSHIASDSTQSLLNLYKVSIIHILYTFLLIEIVYFVDELKLIRTEAAGQTSYGTDHFKNRFSLVCLLQFNRKTDSSALTKQESILTSTLGLQIKRLANLHYKKKVFMEAYRYASMIDSKQLI